jgi:hypothetical protein
VDWPSVNIVHHVPIPAEIQALLDSVSPRGGLTLPAGGSRGMGGQLSAMPLDRKGSGNSSPSSKANLSLGKTPSMSIPPRGSPQQLTASLANMNLRSGANGPSSVPNASIMDQYQTHRRQTHPEYSERRSESHSSHSSPSRKYADLEGSVSRRNSSSRPPLPAATPSMSVTKVTVDAQPHTPVRRRASVSNPTPSKSSPTGTRPGDRSTGPSTPRSQSKKSSDEISSASSSSGSSDGLGSMTDSTVTSDGGFTDYLSDESEAELQRQAEAKAALVAQTQAEEQEFKAARQQLAHVDLRPPKSWNPGANVSRLNHPSLSSPYASSNAAYTNTPFTSSPMAHAAAQSRG